MSHHEVVILGSGPAGLTAAIYAARADLKPLVIEGMQPGGQLTITTEVENYPGFPKGILGPDMMMAFREQAARFGTEFLAGDVTVVDLKATPKKITLGKNELTADTIIISTGASARLLGLPSEKKLMGHGVSACATCDGFFFKGLEVAVVGGGDTALEEATFLTKFASKVTVIHRRDTLRASKAMQQRAFDNKKIQWIWDTAVEDFIDDGSGKLSAVKLKNLKTNELSELKCDGCFVAIGHVPNTSLFKGQLKLDEKGYIVPNPYRTTTDIPGVFACGDVQDSYYRQAVSAAGTGCMAALDAERYLAEHKNH
ncbi:MAG: thioredoxin-disulfide reductase [Deltaproteobacteria bacterium CG11_big_fil_rev_8_21_14_0_20_47_16]|nr:MAG: thioredoxin-disulfide reductase [Deltaproteobacteria bacterium CG11_big_fil_rev_8_21_14_0_20_47_16]